MDDVMFSYYGIYRRTDRLGIVY